MHHIRRYRKKPVVIFAAQVPNAMEPFEALRAELREHAPTGGVPRTLTAWPTADGLRGIVGTLEGDMAFQTGDWLIIGVHNELYPCKDDIFVETYHLAEPEAKEEDV